MYTLYFIVVMLAPAAMLIVGLKWTISPPMDIPGFNRPELSDDYT